MSAVAEDNLIRSGSSLGLWSNILHPEGIKHSFQKQFILLPSNFASVRYNQHTFLTK
jgi:hypothetical protein